MNHLDLFSGIGGFALAARWAGFTTVAFCEIEPYCQKVLRKNFGKGITIHNDIKELDGTRYAGTITVLTGGFPCQPYSIAGKRRGSADPRALWKEMFRVIREAKPAWVIGENVANFANMGLDDACSDLESEGYEVQPFIIPAVAVGAPHERKRVFMVAHADAGYGKRGERVQSRYGILPKAVTRDHIDETGVSEGDWRNSWKAEPDVGRISDGIPARVDRLRVLGNAIVPQVVYPIFCFIKRLEWT